MLELLTTEEMSRADALAIARGVTGLALMEEAGRAVAREVIQRYGQAERVVVLCGPGNNGGDGFVAARHLKEAGFSVRLALLGKISNLKGDAAAMAAVWSGETKPLTPSVLEGGDVVIDAIFGAGLTRPVDGVVCEVIEAVCELDLPVIAVDVPSGIDGTSGQVRGVAARAVATVTFFRRKPGHLLMPGRNFCGSLRVADIGIPVSVLAEIAPKTFSNAPALWLSCYPWPTPVGHKYTRGHCVVVSGGAESTGAARLGARAALRVGAGLVTLAGSKAATAVNAVHVTAVMVHSFQGVKGITQLLKDTRKNTVLIGPGAGVGARTSALVLAALKSEAALILDADALTSFEKKRGQLFGAIRKRSAGVVLTPHEGEFDRLFGDGTEAGSRLDKARKAAAQSGAVIVLKGTDSIIAAPDGRAVINENAPAWLATAGSGDVLAGLITGLMAQGMPAFEASCAAVWLHGDAGTRTGPGLIAEDLPERMMEVLSNLAKQAGL